MNARLVACCSLTLAACALSPVEREDPPPPQPRPKPLADQLQARSDQGYEGGLDREDVALAEALATQAHGTGVPKLPCQAPDPLSGSLLSQPGRSDRGGRTIANPTLDLIESFIRSGNRHQRDVALLAVARIGPGSGFSVAFLQPRGPWSRDALAAVTCQRWSPADVHDLWSPERARTLSALPHPQRAAMAIDLMITQMLDKSLAWPDGVFRHALTNRGYERDLTLERVRRLLPMFRDSSYFRDASYPLSIRLQALEFVARLGGHPEVFEEPLLELRATASGPLARAADRTLVALRGHAATEVLADIVESDRYREWPRSWGPRRDQCSYVVSGARLVQALLKRIDDPILDVRRTAIRGLGCLRAAEAVPALLRALSQPFWSQQKDAVEALGRMESLSDDARAAVARVAQEHWSSQVREAAMKALSPPASRTDEPPRRRGFIIRHRTANNHGLPVCHGKTPGDGKYLLPGGAAFDVRWNQAKVHDLPAGFPLELHEMRKRKGYGSNTFLRVPGGWLYSTDLWHYNSEFGFVSDGGQKQPLAGKVGSKAAHAAFIIETQLGITILGEDIYDGGEGGLLAVLERQPDGAWKSQVILELPSEAFGHAFAPDGTLLVTDPHGSVAITRERKILPLACAN